MSDRIDRGRADPQRVERALRGLADAFAAGATPPAAAGLRAWATRRLLARRAATAVLAAGAVAALAIGGVQVIDLAAGPPAPPAGTPTPAPSPTAAPPTATASPQPPPVPGITPSPRPAPLEPPAPPDDPITEVEWRNAAITLPPHDDCPDGLVQFVAESDIYPDAIGPSDGYPALAISATRAAYGDLTGDGTAEAVLSATCLTSSEHASGHGERLLVVARGADGSLTGLGYVGDPRFSPLAWWIEDGALLMDAGPDELVASLRGFPAVPGLALAYRWDGNQFVGWEPASEYPPIVPLPGSGAAPPVRPRAVAAGLGCPDVELRFTLAENDWGGTTTAAGATFSIRAKQPTQQHLFDLDNTGQRLLVTALGCTDTDGWTREGLAVFERAGDGWRGISVLAPPDGYGTATVDGWTSLDAAGAPMDGALTVTWVPVDGGGPPSVSRTYHWTGTVLETVE